MTISPIGSLPTVPVALAASPATVLDRVATVAETTAASALSATAAQEAQGADYLLYGESGLHSHARWSRRSHPSNQSRASRTNAASMWRPKCGSLVIPPARSPAPRRNARAPIAPLVRVMPSMSRGNRICADGRRCIPDSNVMKSRARMRSRSTHSSRHLCCGLYPRDACGKRHIGRPLVCNTNSYDNVHILRASRAHYAVDGFSRVIESMPRSSASIVQPFARNIPSTIASSSCARSSSNSAPSRASYQIVPASIWDSSEGSSLIIQSYLGITDVAFPDRYRS